MKEHMIMSQCSNNNSWRNSARVSGALLLAAMLLAGCGRNDQLGAQTTPQPSYPDPNAAVAPASSDATSIAVYPAPNAAAIAPSVTPDSAYPVPATVLITVTPLPTDDSNLIDLPSGEIGLIIDMRKNTVVEVVPNSPAQAAGIRVGDVITQVEGKPVGDKFRDAKIIMGGKLFKPVNVEILRQGEKQVLSIKASTLILPTVAPDQPTPTPILDPYTYL
jgi:membrane-associated protease RseP (regulator of RpoE activity)